MKALFTTVFRRAVYLVLCLLTIVGFLSGRAQTKLAPEDRVTNIRLTAFRQTSLEILYDLAISTPGDSVYFEVTGRKSGPISYNPGFVEGDFGRNVTPGLSKRITWNVIANGYELNEEIRVRVLVKSKNLQDPAAAPGDSSARQTPVAELAQQDSTMSRRRLHPYQPGGPLTALLSVLVPGLGNVFVQSPKPRVGLRPLLTVGVLGAIAYGLNQRKQADRQYALYEHQKNPAEGEPYYQRANQQYHRFYIATTAAAAFWLSDIAATLIRGIQNRQVRRETSAISLRLDYQVTTPVAAFTLRF